MAANPADATSSILVNLKNWAAQPFSSQMDLTGWFLWTGLVLVLIVAWTMIIHELEITL